MPRPWRLVIDGPVDGVMNMALDRAVLLSHAEGLVPPTLRLYRWTRPTVTLGRFQKLASVDIEYCAAHGIDLARRPTGGRGVLHDDEVTYSVVAGVADGVPRGTSPSYRYLCQALVRAYRALGVEASLTERARGSAVTGACYLQTTEADLSLGAAKLSGSAQVWSRDSVLQHGSFVISRDLDREARVFRLDEAQARKLAAETATISESLGRRPTDDHMAEAIAAGFEAALGVQLEPAQLTEVELDRARRLVDDALLPRGQD